MKKYPFQKLLIYFIVNAKFDRVVFARLLEKYLPSVQFNHDDPFTYISNILNQENIPKSILTGNATLDTLKLFYQQYKLSDLNAIIKNEDFQDLVFDSDVRKKLEGMSLSPVFRDVDILREFNTINTLYIETYLDCFSDYKELISKRNFIEMYIGDKRERNLYLRILENTSKYYLRVILDIKMPDLSPNEVINNALHAITLKVQNALLAEDDLALERWLKLQVSVSNNLHKLGANNKTDLDNLMEALQAEPIFDDPILYTKEKLEEKFVSQQ